MPEQQLAKNARTIHIGVRILVPMVVVLMVAVAILQIQLFQRDDDIETLKVQITEVKISANKAQAAAESAERSLQAAIESSRAQSNGSNNAVAQIAEIHACVVERKC